VYLIDKVFGALKRSLLNQGPLL